MTEIGIGVCVACDRFGSRSICHVCEARELCGCPWCFPPFQPTRESLARAIMTDLEERLGLDVYEYEIEWPRRAPK